MDPPEALREANIEHRTSPLGRLGRLKPQLNFRSIDVVAAVLNNSRVDNACVVTAFGRDKPDIL